MLKRKNAKRKSKSDSTPSVIHVCGFTKANGVERFCYLDDPERQGITVFTQTVEDEYGLRNGKARKPDALLDTRDFKSFNAAIQDARRRQRALLCEIRIN